MVPFESEVLVEVTIPSISFPPAHCALLGWRLIRLTFWRTSGAIVSSIKSLIGYSESEKMSSDHAKMPSSSHAE